jgi:hypothetical protein
MNIFEKNTMGMTDRKNSWVLHDYRYYKKLLDKKDYYTEVKTTKDVDNIKDNDKLLLDFAKKLLKISSSDMQINGIVKERIRNFNIETILK